MWYRTLQRSPCLRLRAAVSRGIIASACVFSDVVHEHMSFRWRSYSSPREDDEQRRKYARRSHSSSLRRSSDSGQSALRPCLAGMMFAAAIFYMSGWQLGRDHTVMQTNSHQFAPGIDDWKPVNKIRSRKGILPQATAASGEKVAEEGNRVRSDGVVSSSRDFFSIEDMLAVTGAVERYAASSKSTLAADKLATEQGKPMQGRYIVLESGNELANRLRGVLSGFFLGMLTDRVFVADITYQQDITRGLLSALFEGPGYQWDLSELSPQLGHQLAPNRAPKVVFDMYEDSFRTWVCDDVLASTQLSTALVITLSTVVYPLPLLARNPTYASHAILAAGTVANLRSANVAKHPDTVVGDSKAEQLEWEGFAGGGQRRIEALETLLTRAVLRPTAELRARAKDLHDLVRAKADAWGKMRGIKAPPRVVGLHLRTYFITAVSSAALEASLEEFASCAKGGRTGFDETFYFVATDDAQTQKVAQKVWGDGCYFADFGLTGSFQDGIKSALVDLLVMGSFDDFVMTPHSSFSELGASLSYTWLLDYQDALRIVPHRPLIPIFTGINSFERRKIESLLDRRAAPARIEGGKAECRRLYAAGMSVVVARGKHLTSMFGAIEDAKCLQGRKEIADV